MRMFQEMRQLQETVRLQLLQQQQMQQQVFQYFSSCFGALYSHAGPIPPQPPAPLLPTDPAAYIDPSASLPQTPLASFPMSPLLHPGVFGYPQQTPMTPDQRR